MKRHSCLFFLSFLSVALFTGTAFAHVPYLEQDDFTWDDPFVVKKTIQQSIAVYSYLDAETDKIDGDVDVYRFDIKVPQMFYAEVIVPVCPGYESFRPWFALVGPGLSYPVDSLPFDLPEGYGAMVAEDVDDGEDREFFYEFFGDKSYYQGPVINTKLEETGVYYVVYWNPEGEAGDYVAVLGDKELWFISDMLRALIVTPMIRKDKELHIACDEEL